MLQFDDSCYEDAKQYHLASFSTCNSTLNASLRKPIRMQDFIQLCDSIGNMRTSQEHSKENFMENLGGKLSELYAIGKGGMEVIRNGIVLHIGLKARQ